MVLESKSAQMNKRRHVFIRALFACPRYVTTVGPLLRATPLGLYGSVMGPSAARSFKVVHRRYARRAYGGPPVKAPETRALKAGAPAYAAECNLWTKDILLTPSEVACRPVRH